MLNHSRRYLHIWGFSNNSRYIKSQVYHETVYAKIIDLYMRANTLGNTLEDNEDVQRVAANFDIEDAVLERLSI